MYWWQDRDSVKKLKIIQDKLVDNGYDARRSNSMWFIKLYDSNGEYVCEAYSTPCYCRGLIWIQRYCHEIKLTHDPYEAYDIMIDYFNSKRYLSS